MLCLQLVAVAIATVGTPLLETAHGHGRHTHTASRFQDGGTQSSTYLPYYYNICCITPLEGSGPIWKDQRMPVFIQRTGELLPQNKGAKWCRRKSWHCTDTFAGCCCCPDLMQPNRINTKQSQSISTLLLGWLFAQHFTS